MAQLYFLRVKLLITLHITFPPMQITPEHVRSIYLPIYNIFITNLTHIIVVLKIEISDI